ncbi:MAG: tRNA pseudouridine(38-40) synthase TruA, partial [Oscillospiraceae bacterium]|nr:tRNA pseudouridine(38-40) synthase TruA [Oscillospiraceae bacterium]
AAQHFLGSHDFSAFCAAGGSVEDKVRTIYDARVCREGDIVNFSVTGSGFLYNMVRIMAGTLLAVGQHRLSPDQIPSIIESMERSRAGMTLPPDGLYLDDVFYFPEQLPQQP